MEIIGSFLGKNSQYTFTKLAGDASKKEYYCIDHEPDLLLVKITTEINAFDEKFDEINVGFSQYDYLKHTFGILENVPKIVSSDNDNGIIIMENLGNLRLKEKLEEDMDLSYIEKSIDWLVKLFHKNNISSDMIHLRHYGKNAMIKEMDKFLKYGLKYISEEDKKIFIDETNQMINFVCQSTTSINHRDYQLRNIMIKNGNIYVIDTQDICIGPYFCDLCTLLFNNSVVFGTQMQEKYAAYFYDKISPDDSIDVFYQKFWIYGFLRILKSLGSHTKHFVKNNRVASLEIIENNKILLEQTKEKVNNDILYNILDKYKLVPIILAAGKGTRMNSILPKTLCEINGKPMLFHILDTITKLCPYQIVIVVGHKKEQIMNKLEEYPYKNISFVEQKNLLGTGHAVMQTRDVLNNFHGQVLVLFGDNPFVPITTLEELITNHYHQKLDASIISYFAQFSHQKQGRVIRNDDGRILQIYEDPDENFPSNEYIGGMQLYNNQKLHKYLTGITTDNNKNEYYLADVIKIMQENDCSIGNVVCHNKENMINVNTKDDLSIAEKWANNNFPILH